jgi:hypothetical protein
MDSIVDKKIGTHLIITGGGLIMGGLFPPIGMAAYIATQVLTTGTLLFTSGIIVNAINSVSGDE